ncbi:MAG: DegT/DnrJ/EryC1/StrS family aminotransferase, partial [Gammaproteobacteria bacterium]|nr:DegT/DnrJ/EryC1/StrS family aminotransferase [Gammaproteobacteria bacterium]
MGEIDFPMWPTYCEEEIQAVEKVLRSGRVNYWTGENGKKFECEFAAKFQCEFGVALANGTVALDAALYSLDIGISDEVIVTSRTFIASASAVVLRGAKPVFADVDLESQNITPQSIEPLISKNTKAIITVHLAGWPCEMLEIMDLAKTHGLFVIEDCAQAHGAVIHNQPIGSWGDVSVFSFCQDKIMSTGGEGGMLLTKSRHLWEKVWSYKDHGKNFDKISNPGTDKGHFRWLHDSFGTNFRMTELQAAIGRIQLGYLPKWLEIRKQNAEYMASCLEDVEALRVPMPPDYVEHANYKFY